jgi:hypothetical protein
MKLLLQLLFVQGWLWRDRFPDEFRKAKLEHRGLAAYLVYLYLIFSIVLLFISIGFLADGDLSRGVFLALLAAAWFLWALSSREFGTDASGKEFRLSAIWATGFLFAVSVVAFLAMVIMTADWLLLPPPIAFLLCLVTGWLRGIQGNYLIFRDPVNNAWRLKQTRTETGLVRPLVNSWIETYWRLPLQIFFPTRGQRHAE